MHEKLDFSHVQSKCGSKDNLKHSPKGGNVCKPFSLFSLLPLSFSAGAVVGSSLMLLLCVHLLTHLFVCHWQKGLFPKCNASVLLIFSTEKQHHVLPSHEL